MTSLSPVPYVVTLMAALSSAPLAGASPALIGEPTVHRTTGEDTLLEIARDYDVGYVAIIAANPAAVGFNRRRHPLYIQARGVLTAGVIGRVRSMQTAFSEPVVPEEMPGWKRSIASIF